MILKYRLNSLGWYNFENLAHTVLKKIIGPGVSSFGGVKDSGRDATFEGSAEFPSKTTQWEGYWVFQVKHSEEEKLPTKEIENFLKSIEKELEKIKAKYSKWPDNYVYITSFNITNKTKDLATQRVKETNFDGNFHIVDGREVCEFLDIHPQIRRGFPQLIGLADLDYLMNKSIYEMSKAFLLNWKSKLESFVSVDPYFKALETLQMQRFVIIDGPPEIGKTTIGAAICCAYALEDYEIYFIQNPKDFFSSFKYESKQLFFADDAIGSISFSPSLGDDWSRDLPLILGRLDSNHKLIWTSRTYILREALESSKLKEGVDKFPDVHEVLIEISDYSLKNKALFLYNHAKNSEKLSKKVKELIKKFASEICNHKNVTPERIRQLIAFVLPDEVKNNDTEEKFLRTVVNFLDNPGEKFLRAYKNLKESEKELLLTLLDCGFYTRKNELRKEYEKRTTTI